METPSQQILAIKMASISSSVISTGPLARPKLPTGSRTVRLRPACAKRHSNGSDFGYGSGLVDESMIVLRKRIHELEMAERNYEAPSHWSDWERRYYAARYGSDVCALAGLLQTLLLKTRPGVGIGIVVLMAMSVPASAVLIWGQLVELLKAGGFGG